MKEKGRKGKRVATPGRVREVGEAIVKNSKQLLICDSVLVIGWTVYLPRVQTKILTSSE